MFYTNFINGIIYIVFIFTVVKRDQMSNLSKSKGDMLKYDFGESESLPYEEYSSKSEAACNLQSN